jgi:hypothetical protein
VSSSYLTAGPCRQAIGVNFDHRADLRTCSSVSCWMRTYCWIDPGSWHHQLGSRWLICFGFGKCSVTSTTLLATLLQSHFSRGAYSQKRNGRGSSRSQQSCSETRQGSSPASHSRHWNLKSCRYLAASCAAGLADAGKLNCHGSCTNSVDFCSASPLVSEGTRWRWLRSSSFSISLKSCRSHWRWNPSYLSASIL